MPTFHDTVPYLPEADYIFCVVEFEIGISAGKNTAGSEQYILTLAIEPSGKKIKTWITDHESCSWQLDTFLKSAGVQLARGETFEFRQDVAEQNGLRWVNPLGLRGWCRLSVEDYKGMKQNKVSLFYTDKPKLKQAEVDETDLPF